MPAKRAIIIGSGFSGIAAATCLAQQGLEVIVLEKNNTLGGRARQLKADGFTFDLGPSWYWMPDVFEKYFSIFGKKPSDYYELIRLDPSYAVVFGKDDTLEIPANYEQLRILLNSIESGSAEMLDRFMNQAKYKYNIGINKLVYKPSRSFFEFISIRLLLDVIRLDVFKSFGAHIRKYFHHTKILQLMEFPILFLGAIADNTPALYSLMNYADIKLGTWYPKGGMYSVVQGMVQLAESLGVRFVTNANVQSFRINNDIIDSLETENERYEADVVVASADYHHVETAILPPSHRSYSNKYWDSRVLAPSSLLFYIGLNTKIKGLLHHTLFFDEDFEPHASEIYVNPRWPSRPLFYVSIASKTDDSVAPKNGEAMVILIPVAPDLKDEPTIRDHYFNLVIKRIEHITGQDLTKHIIFKKSYAHNDFMQDYNAFKGNAYGLANTLKQTAILKPALKSKKIKNLYYTGQLTVPGPGVPPSLISGQVVAQEIIKHMH